MPGAVIKQAPTIDDKEVNHFKKLSVDWWDEFGEVKALHAMNKLRIPFIQDGLITTGRVAQQLKNITILEVGCGGGILAEPLARTGRAVTAIDISAELIDVAIQHAGLDPTLSKLKYHVESVEEHAAANPEKYDAVVASEVLEHVNEQELFLETCVKCLKPGGSLFITTLNKTTASWLYGIIAAEYVFNFIPRGTHEWDKFIAPQEVARILEKYNCKTKSVAGQFYNFINNKWSWTGNTSIFYVLHAVKIKMEN